METLHTIGVVALVFIILPSLDVVKGAMLTNCLCFMPGFLGMLSRHSGETKRVFKTMLDFISVIIQFAGFIIWPIVAKEERNGVASFIPIVCFLVSLGWWENFVDKNSSIGFIRSIAQIKNRLHKTRYFTYIFISIWKMLLIFICMIISIYLIDGSVKSIFTKFKESFSSHKILIQRDKSDLITFANTDQFIGIEGETFEINSRSAMPLWFIIVQILATWICYVVAKFACKICIQGFSFAFPISLTVPVTISALIGFCGVHFDNKCKISDFFIPKYLFWYCHEEPFIRDEPFFNIHAIMWLGWLLSQTWIAIHIWAPKCERLATTEKLFVNPMYSGVIIDQSIALNRRRDDEEEIKSEDINLETDGTTMQDPSQHYETISEHMDDKKKSNTFSSDQIIRIYACATMWHETAEEMIQMLKSVFRMDEDQSARRNAQKYLKIVDPDYYEFEGILNKHSKLLFLFLNTTCFQFIFSLTMLLNCVMKTTKKWL
jgi:chitin synthase